ncbi:MAG: type II toxin-antitoxin system RelE/ParE family toxin [Deltaproteobacteria bacterium]|nr:type II toxin-antitoxin system RelE/ParE family toxin [Deltaproteobacteria bacterium]
MSSFLYSFFNKIQHQARSISSSVDRKIYSHPYFTDTFTFSDSLLDNPTAAQKWVDNIFKKVGLLQFSPEIGRIVPEIERREIRELIFGNYRIIYRFEKTNISILTIRHSKQILPTDDLEA